MHIRRQCVLHLYREPDDACCILVPAGAATRSLTVAALAQSTSVYPRASISLIYTSASLVSLLLLFAAGVSVFASDLQDELLHVGQRLDGDPVGFMTTIEGVDTYVTLPTDLRAPPTKALLFLTDIFGVALVNSRLLADQFAAKGFPTFVPDYFDGDPVPVNQTGFNMTAWSLRHTEANTTVPLLKVIDGLKNSGVTKFAATGYCFGGRFIIRLSQNDTITVGVTAHPSQLVVPDDFVKLSAVGKSPLQIHSGELDPVFSSSIASIADSVMNATGPFSDLSPYAPGYVRINHPGVSHGFAVRPANASDPVQIAAMQEAFEESATFLAQHF